MRKIKRVVIKKKVTQVQVLSPIKILVKPKLSQVWVETVIYTLIGLTIIGILLAVSKPKIDSMKDKLVIEQTITSMSAINSKIFEIRGVSGNKRIVEVKVSKGKLFIDGINDSIYWVQDSSYQYSEADKPVSIGDLNVLTQEGSPWTITVSASYPWANITYQGQDQIKELDAAPSPYLLTLESKGNSNGGIVVDVSA